MPRVNKQTAAKKPTSRRPSRPKSAWDRISQVEFETTGIKINLYGKSGTGKTTLWSTFPGPILSIIASGSDKPGELLSIGKEQRKKIRKVNLQSSNEIEELVEGQAETNQFATVVLDHATGLQDLVLKEILGLEEIPTQKSWGLATQQQYGQCALQMKERLRSLLNLDCNVVIVAQEREFNTDVESDVITPSVGSALTPSVTGWLNPACDYICETFIREQTKEQTTTVRGKEVKQSKKTGKVEYCLRTGPDAVFTTKFRVPKGHGLPDVIVDPDYQKIMDVINGGR